MQEEEESVEIQLAKAVSLHDSQPLATHSDGIVREGENHAHSGINFSAVRPSDAEEEDEHVAIAKLLSIEEVQHPGSGSSICAPPDVATLPQVQQPSVIFLAWLLCRRLARASLVFGFWSVSTLTRFLGWVLMNAKRRVGPDGGLESRTTSSPLAFVCTICTEPTLDDSVFLVQCGSGHRFCCSCVCRHVKTQLFDNGRKPACLGGCAYELQEPDIQKVIKCGRSQLSSDESQRILNLLENIDMYNLGLVRCPKCPAWLEPPENERAAECICGHRFCIQCFQPYHYQVNCAEANRLVERFALWQQEGRQSYLKASAHNAEERRRYEIEKSAHSQRVQEVDDRLKEYHDMEAWKASFCKMCPHCGRVVQRLEGCPVMRCGFDTDTHKNVQNGCGNSFNWDTAAQYQPRPPQMRPVVEEFSLQEPPGPPSTHEIEPGVPMLCDGCQQPLVGARFRCIHCSCFECCIDCEMTISLGRNINHTARNHTFDVLL